jgi:copper chaperone CopZ
MSYIEYKVTGMSCQHCVAKVKTALESVQGVRNVNVSRENNTVSIEADPLPPVNVLNEALQDHGHYQISV